VFGGTEKPTNAATVDVIFNFDVIDGDALHAVLCGAGHNIRLLPRKLRLPFFQILMQLMMFAKPACCGLAPNIKR